MKNISEILCSPLRNDHRKKVKILINTILIVLISVSQAYSNIDYPPFEKLNFLNNIGESRISGRVTDQAGEPIPGVSVIIKETTRGVATDADGVFNMSEVPEGAILVFSFVGMETQEVVVGNQSTINVVLKDDSYRMNELVVVGYSTVKKGDLTGSISSINADDLSKSGAVNLAQAIQGKTSGVLISKQGGRPGAGISVRVRGIGGVTDSEPLYVVDGIYGGNLSGINPDEIESIQILKDASSAAIYGARGANGVVLITTKRGKSGKMQVSYNGSYGFQNIINAGNVEVLNSQQYAEVQNTMYKNDGKLEPFGGDPALPSALFPSPSQITTDTNWLDLMTTKNAPIHNHLLSFSGGSDKSTFYVSMSYLDQEGMYLNSGYKKYNFRVNSDHEIRKWLKIGNSTSYGNTETTGVGRTDEKFGQFVQSLIKEPTIPVYDSEGNLAGPAHPFYGPSRTPFASVVTSDYLNKSFGISNNLYVKINPIKYITLKTSFANNYYAAEGRSYANNIYKEGIVSGSEVKVGQSNVVSSGWTWSNTLMFDKDFMKHNVHALLGYESRYDKSSSINGSATYLDPAYKIVNSAAAEVSGLGNRRSEDSMISYFASLNYNYDDKYYFTGNVRRDGSSRFGNNNRFGVFPSFSVAWRLSSEDFFPQNKIVSNVKFRASYGKVGNDKIGLYRYIAAMANVFYSFNGMEGDFASGLVTSGLANPDLKWETSTQTNFGLDLMLFDSKLQLTADYFKTDVTDMLLGKIIPSTAGIASLAWGTYASVITNAGSLTNKGFEFELNYENAVGDLGYSIHTNLTTYDNEITDLAGNDHLTGNGGGSVERNRTYEGGSLADFYGYVWEGIFQTQQEIDAAAHQTDDTVPGDFKFKDLNGDGVIDAEDRQVIGSPLPDFTYGFGIDLSYKRFSLSTLFYGTKGNQVYNALRGELEQQGRSFNKSVSVLDAWHGPGTSNTIPIRRVQDLNQNFRTSTAYLEDASFLRLQNIMISYDVPVNFGKLRVSFSGDNLLTLTKYTGFNPEVSLDKSATGGNRLDAGVDAGYYPSASVYRIGVNVSF